MALSYCWGPRGPDETLLLEGQLYRVTPNLYAALKSIRWGIAGVIDLRIDSLCIDQSDDVEKEHQVSLMGAIYSNAVLVVMWLGPETKDCALAKKLADDFTGIIFELDQEKSVEAFWQIYTSEKYDFHWKAFQELLFWSTGKEYGLYKDWYFKNFGCHMRLYRNTWMDIRELTNELSSPAIEYRRNARTALSTMMMLTNLGSTQRALQNGNPLTPSNLDFSIFVSLP